MRSPKQWVSVRSFSRNYPTTESKTTHSSGIKCSTLTERDGPYVQYTHARCASVLRKAGEAIVKKAAALEGVDFQYLCSESAYELAKLLYKFPAVIVDAGEKYEPSIVTRHIVDMAQGLQPFLSR